MGKAAALLVKNRPTPRKSDAREEMQRRLLTCWFHRRPAPSSRWHRRDWRSRVSAEPSSGISAHPSAGRCEPSSALVWPFGPLWQSETRKSNLYIKWMKKTNREQRTHARPGPIAKRKENDKHLKVQKRRFFLHSMWSKWSVWKNNLLLWGNFLTFNCY